MAGSPLEPWELQRWRRPRRWRRLHAACDRSPIVDPHRHRIDLDLSAGEASSAISFSARVDVLNVASAPVNFSLSWRDDHMPQEDFYGLGQGSSESHRVSYLLDTTDVTAAAEWKPLIASTSAARSRTLARDYTHRPALSSIEAAFDPSTAPGLGGLPDFIRADATLGFDWRDNASYAARRTGIRSRPRATTARATIARTSGASTSIRSRSSARQSLPEVELRAQAALTGADDTARVPVITCRTSAAPRPCAPSRRRAFKIAAVSMSAEYQ